MIYQNPELDKLPDALELRRILNIFQITNESFSKEDFDSMLTVTKLDFNDKLIELLCKKKNMLLLTHDFDFSLSDVDILSANRNFKSR